MPPARFALSALSPRRNLHPALAAICAGHRDSPATGIEPDKHVIADWSKRPDHQCPDRLRHYAPRVSHAALQNRRRPPPHAVCDNATMTLPLPIFLRVGQIRL